MKIGDKVKIDPHGIMGTITEIKEITSIKGKVFTIVMVHVHAGFWVTKHKKPQQRRYDICWCLFARTFNGD